MAPPTANTGVWERKKQELRRFESDIETQLIQLENMDIDAEVAEVKSVHQEAQRLVGVMRASARALYEWGDNGTSDSSLKMRQQAERYENIAAEKDRALVQVMQSLHAKRSRHHLLSDVQHELEEYQESQGSRLLNQEADHIARATADAQRLHEQANASHQQMKDQFNVFTRAADRAAHIVNMAPGLNNILQKIQSKRQRDSIILASLIGVCLFMIWYFW
eukprot:TRINITY_DN12365_c0_g1_i1.p1 TRINITY_DN12365_c0_g1~~TRINITY_DN12365_c0_g1_i1.p1  ORF type:complete len:220 (+),score=39.67 TRINITY_DN12365_c0_g1_i1:64-723(+)